MPTEKGKPRADDEQGEASLHVVSSIRSERDELNLVKRF